jgi:hypothetical protein
MALPTRPAGGFPTGTDNLIERLLSSGALEWSDVVNGRDPTVPGIETELRHATRSGRFGRGGKRRLQGRLCFEFKQGSEAGSPRRRGR